MEKMKPEIKAKWITALRSGDYRQGKGYLHKQVDGSDQYCCLGVLCDLYLKEVGEEWRQDMCGVFSIPDGMRVEVGVLPDDVMTWSGMFSCTGTVRASYPSCKYVDSLAEINDRSDNFDRVIDLIEEYF